MNTNEVLANRAAELLGGARGAYDRRAPQRSRQHGPVDQRRVPDRDAAGAGDRSTVRFATRAARSHRRSSEKADALRRRAQGRPHAPAGRGADHARTGVRRLCGVPARGGGRQPTPRSTALHELNLGATAVGTGLNAGDDYTQLAVAALARLTGAAARAGAQPLSRDAEHGRRRHLLGRAAAHGRRARQDRQRPAAAVDGAARRHRRDHAAGGAARLVDHAGQGESVGARDGQPGVLSGLRLRHHGHGRRRRGTARAERDDAGDRVERAARAAHPDRRRCARCASGRSRASRPIAARARELLDRSTAVATALSPYIGYAATAEIAKAAVASGRPIRDARARARAAARRASSIGFSAPRR